jgi:DNA-binding transcriptional LysR family regulator
VSCAASIIANGFSWTTLFGFFSRGAFFWRDRLPVINLVALGMGVSFVPIRALALYNQRRSLFRVPFQPRFTRELVVVIRKHRKTPEHLNQFIANVLF